MSQHTPGPWTHDATNIRDADGRTVAWVGWGSGCISRKITGAEQIANAALLAQAPAMREALNIFALNYANLNYMRAHADTVRAILRAIEGA